jgi:hypothetical protein
MIAPLCSSKTAFLPVDQVKRPEKAVFVFEKVFMCKKLQHVGFLNLARQICDLTLKTSLQWILPGAIVEQASLLRSKDLRSQFRRPPCFPKVSNGKDFGKISDSPQSAFDPFFKLKLGDM